MTWLAEDPFWLILALTLLSVSGVIVGFSGAGRAFYAVAGIFFLAAISVFFYERAIETDREILIADIINLAYDVENNDLESAIQHFHPDATDAITHARNEMPTFEFKSCNVTAFKDIEFDNPDSPTEATIEFRVFVNVDASRSQFRLEKAMAARGVVLTYGKTTAGKWKVTAYRHFDPNQKQY